MRSVRWMSLFASFGGAMSTAALAVLPTGMFAPAVSADVLIHDERTSSPIVLDRVEDYLLRKVFVSGVRDGAALTLAGQIESVRLENCQFGDVRVGVNGHAAAVEAIGARIGSFVATDSSFYDSENQLVSLRDGSFGTVTFLHCTFKTSDEALHKMYESNPWRTGLPTTEFFNIDRLELLDNEYVNTTIVIHPSVKMVVFRGDVSKLRIQSPETQVINLAPGQDPSIVLPPGTEVLAATSPLSEDRVLEAKVGGVKQPALSSEVQPVSVILPGDRSTLKSNPIISMTTGDGGTPTAHAVP